MVSVFSVDSVAANEELGYLLDLGGLLGCLLQKHLVLLVLCLTDLEGLIEFLLVEEAVESVPERLLQVARFNLLLFFLCTLFPNKNHFLVNLTFNPLITHGHLGAFTLLLAILFVFPVL